MLKMRDWELLSSNNPNGEGAKRWLIDFYQERGLSKLKLSVIFNSSKFYYPSFRESVISQINSRSVKDIPGFMGDVWRNAQAAIAEYDRVQESPLFLLRTDAQKISEYLLSWREYFEWGFRETQGTDHVYQHRWFGIYKDRIQSSYLLSLSSEVMRPTGMGWGCSLTIGGESQVDIGVHAGKLGSIHLTLEHLFLLPDQWFPWTDRETGLFLQKGRLWWLLGWDDFGGLRWRGIKDSATWEDVLFGRMRCDRSQIVSQSVEIELAEGRYDATAEAYLATWSRPRGGWHKQAQLVDIRVSDWIPLPDTCYEDDDDEDCDEVIYTIYATTIEEGVEKLTAKINEKRMQYGGEEWISELVEAVHESHIRYHS